MRYSPKFALLQNRAPRVRKVVVEALKKRSDGLALAGIGMKRRPVGSLWRSGILFGDCNDCELFMWSSDGCCVTNECL